MRDKEAERRKEALKSPDFWEQCEKYDLAVKKYMERDRALSAECGKLSTLVCETEGCGRCVSHNAQRHGVKHCSLHREIVRTCKADRHPIEPELPRFCGYTYPNGEVCFETDLGYHAHCPDPSCKGAELLYAYSGICPKCECYG